MPGRKTGPEGSAGTLDSLAKLHFSQGSEGVRKALEGFREERANLRNAHVGKASQGEAVHRTDVGESEGIKYERFNPPWGASYSVLRATFENTPKTKTYIYHSGEELLIPVRGKIAYHFFWSPGSSRPARVLLQPPVGPGDILRIHPQIPHHTWAAEKEGAEAWMFIRHLSDSASHISTRIKSDHKARQDPSRQTTESELANPASYALIAWGIAERIAHCRVRSNMSTVKLARECGLDQSHVSRIESGHTNVSIDTLQKICRVLGIPLDELLVPPAWSFERDAFQKPRWKEKCETVPLMRKPQGTPHALHPISLSIRSGMKHRLEIPETRADEGAAESSWVVLEGRLISEVAESGLATRELLEPGCSLHLRRNGCIALEALQNSRLMGIVLGPGCSCR